MNSSHLLHSSTDSHADSAHSRALVLGGGGSTGNAWLIGVTAGLLEAGINVTDANVTIGTSAGATAAAQFAGAGPMELLATILAAPAMAPPAAQAGVSSPSAGQVSHQMQAMQHIIDSATDPGDLRRRLGRAALELDAGSDGSWQSQWRSTVASRLPSPSWPSRRLLLTAVEASSGEPVVFDNDSGVELVDAVAASCSSRLPYWIHGKPYIDGGHRLNAENADLAVGCARVLVLSPLGGRTLTPPAWGLKLALQVEELRTQGSQVLTITPHASHEHLFGANAMDLSLRPLAAQAGHAQGMAVAGELAELWQ